MSMLLSLPRTVFFSVAIIAGAISLVAAGSTLAAFTTEDTDTGTVTAGTVEITVEGADTPGLVFVPGTTSCPSPMAPGGECEATVTVTNVGSLPVTLDAATATVDSVDLGGCTANTDFTASAGAYTFEGAGPTLSPTAEDAGDDTATYVVTVTLIADPANECQGATATVSTTATGSNP
jgi:predicted ribosomally synthesized peptide with SipW-like signal peptide